MEALERFCCQNSRCADYGKRGAGNLTDTTRYGKNKDRRLLYCRTCKARFSERKGTPFFQARLSDDKCLSLLEHVGEGVGMRKTSRLVRVHLGTVIRYARLAGGHACDLHDELVALSPPDERASVR